MPHKNFLINTLSNWYASHIICTTCSFLWNLIECFPVIIDPLILVKSYFVTVFYNYISSHVASDDFFRCALLFISQLIFFHLTARWFFCVDRVKKTTKQNTFFVQLIITCVIYSLTCWSNLNLTLKLKTHIKDNCFFLFEKNNWLKLWAVVIVTLCFHWQIHFANGLYSM